MVETQNLNQAAMLVTLGGKLIKITGTAPACGFVVEIKPWQEWYEKHIGIVPYKKFCGIRTSIKIKAYNKTGRHREFGGKKDGFLFSELAHVVPFTKLEKERMKAQGFE